MLELSGRRVVLRTPLPEEAERLRALHEAPEVHAWWGSPAADFPFPGQDSETTGLAILQDGEVAGWIEFGQEREPEYRHAWIDLFVDPARHRAGIGTDALRTVIRHLVDDLGHHRITIDPAVDNVAAVACYERVGFRPVGVTHASWRDPEGAWRDCLLMEMVVS